MTLTLQIIMVKSKCWRLDHFFLLQQLLINQRWYMYPWSTKIIIILILYSCYGVVKRDSQFRELVRISWWRLADLTSWRMDLSSGWTLQTLSHAWALHPAPVGPYEQRAVSSTRACLTRVLTRWSWSWKLSSTCRPSSMRTTLQYVHVHVDMFCCSCQSKKVVTHTIAVLAPSVIIVPLLAGCNKLSHHCSNWNFVFVGLCTQATSEDIITTENVLGCWNCFVYLAWAGRKVQVFRYLYYETNANKMLGRQCQPDPSLGWGARWCSPHAIPRYQPMLGKDEEPSAGFK